MRAQIWLDQEILVKVRVAEIDAPELSRASCPAERKKAEAAKDLAEKAIGPGEVKLYNVRYGKYAGRVIADVATRDGDLAALLVKANLANGTWC